MASAPFRSKCACKRRCPIIISIGFRPSTPWESCGPVVHRPVFILQVPSPVAAVVHGGILSTQVPAVCSRR
eukprot:290063-Pyramimonas_sp.AAC.1